MAPSIACNNKKTRRDWFIVSLLMNSPHFSTQALIRSGIPHIALSNISAEKQHQADREFAMRVAFEVTGFILSTLFRTITQRFSMGDRSGMLPDHTPPPQKKSQGSCPGTTAWSWRRCELVLRLVEKCPATRLAEV